MLDFRINAPNVDVVPQSRFLISGNVLLLHQTPKQNPVANHAVGDWYEPCEAT